MIYKWKSVGYSIPAEKVGKIFERMEKDYGEVTSTRVLEEARPEDSILHPIFEWDDTVAAEKYRLEQARKLINNIEIEIEPASEDSEPTTIAAFVDVGETKHARYVNITTAFQNEDMKSVVLKNALNELKAFKEKYRKLKEFDRLFKEIDKLIK